MHFHHFSIHLKSPLVYGLTDFLFLTLADDPTKQKMASDKELTLQAEIDALERALHRLPPLFED
ncbi:hypothetical protein FRB93_011327 [Tulasnella sp. JGI-2019a]|nr:hypothetical protein FRB93_011327 [Tulasnella sp. JGI-2019a]